MLLLDRIEILYKYVALTTACICLILSAMAIVGWYLNISDLFIILNNSGPLQFLSALNFGMVSLAILIYFSSFPHTFPIKLIGFFAAASGILTLLEYIYQSNLGIDELFMKGYVDLQSPYPGRMSPITSAGLILAGLALCLLSKTRINQWKTLIIVICGILIVCIGLIGCLSFIVPIGLFIEDTTRISLLGSFNFLLIGISITLLGMYTIIIHKIKIRDWIPFLITLGLIICTSMISFGIKSNDERFIKKITQSTLEEVKNHIINEIEIDMSNANILSRALQIHGLPPSEEWIAVAKGFLDENKEYRSIFLTNTTNNVQKIITQSEKNNSLTEQQLYLEHKLKHSTDTNLSKSAIYFDPNKHVFLINSPIYTKEKFNGMLFIVVDVKAFVDEVKKSLVDTLGEYYSVTVTAEKEKIVQINPQESSLGNQWESNSHFSFKNIEFAIDVYPTERIISEQINRFLHIFIFVLGIIFSILCGLLVRLWQKSLIYISHLVEMQKALKSSQEQLKLALQSSGTMTWFWDIPNDHFSLDDYAFTFFDLPGGFLKEGRLNDLLNLIHPNDRATVASAFLQAVKRGSNYHSEFRVIHPINGKVFFITAKGTVYRDEIGNALRMSGVFFDATEIKRKEHLLHIQFVIHKVLNDATSIPEAFDQIVREICEFLGWEASVFWLLDSKENVLKFSNSWHIHSLNIDAFIKKSKEMKFSKGHGFIGRIWAFQYPQWIVDIFHDPNFRRSHEAKVDNLHGAIGFPIIGEDQTFLGVIELLQRSTFDEKVDNDFLNLLTTIGNNIGLFLSRKNKAHSEHLLLTMLESAIEAIICITPDNLVTNWNKGAEKIFGYSNKEMVGQSIEKIIPENYKYELQVDLEQLHEKNITLSREFEINSRTGQQKLISAVFSSIYQEQELMGYILIAQDITDLRKREEIQGKNEEKFRTFVETTAEWVWEIDKNQKVTYSNPAIHSILGYLPNEILNVDIIMLVADEDKEELEKHLAQCIERKKGWVGRTTRWKHKNGSKKWLESNAEPILNERNELLGFRGTDRDVTERKHIETMKNEFISTVSHELRTPLTSIRGSLGLLEESSLEKFSDKTKELLKIASNNCSRLIRLINDILDVEKLEDGKMTYNLVPIDVKKLVLESVKTNQSYTQTYKVSLNIDQMPEGEVFIKGDYDRLLQVLANLISNAAKFSREGGQILVDISATADKVKISVTDHGEGIPEWFKPNIFKMFAQADSSSTRSASGTGLGLYISKNMVGKMNGEINFTSKVHEGTTFNIEFTRWFVPASKE